MGGLNYRSDTVNSGQSLNYKLSSAKQEMIQIHGFIVYVKDVCFMAVFFAEQAMSRSNRHLKVKQCKMGNDLDSWFHCLCQGCLFYLQDGPFGRIYKSWVTLMNQVFRKSK